MRWSELTEENIGALDATDFQRFCVDLAEFEARTRFVRPDIVRGSSKPGVKDGGLEATIRKPSGTPRVSSDEFAKQATPLLDDDRDTGLNCKRGPNWKDLVRKDLRKAKLIEFLLGGGVLVVFHSVPSTDPAGDCSSLVDAAWEEMKTQAPGTSRDEVRIRPVGPPDLVAYLRAVEPDTGPMRDWAQKFNLGKSKLLSFAEWKTAHDRERALGARLEMERDTPREGLMARVAALVARGPTEQRIAWIVGPPGVGKTRLILQALQGVTEIEERVEVASDASGADAPLSADWPPSSSRILVVDDCRDRDEAERLAKNFRSVADRAVDARLILITPSSEPTQHGGLDPWRVEGLGDDAMRRLLSQLGVQPAVLGQFTVWCSGYPWFAVLLAKELVVPSAPTELPPLREAVWLAIGGRGTGETESARVTRSKKLARALLAASVTTHLDWGDLDEAQRDSVWRAVGLESWSECLDLAEACWRRGLLRRRLGWKIKYVTPAIILHEIVAWYFDPDDGPPGGARDFLKHAAALRGFAEWARRFMPDHAARELGRALLEELQGSTASLASLAQARMLDVGFEFAARHLPLETGVQIAPRIEATAIEDLRADAGSRRALVYALEEIACRQGGFELAEPALFRLAQAENEPHGANATDIWTWLFHSRAGQTYCPLGARIELLERRAMAPGADPTLALAAARVLFADGVYRRALEPRDGPRPEPTRAEITSARERTREWLVRQSAETNLPKPSPTRETLIELLRTAVKEPDAAAFVRSLAPSASAWTLGERAKLGEKLSAIRAYHEALTAEVEEAIRELESALSPADYSMRLRQHAAVWGVAKLRDEAALRDEKLTVEGVSQSLLGAELVWLVSDEAKRALRILHAAGRHDTSASLLHPLTKLASASEPGRARDALASYLRGACDAGHGWLASAIRTLRDDATQQALFVFVVARLPASEDDLVAIKHAVASDSLDDVTLDELGRNTWHEHAPDAFLVELVTLLVRTASAAGPRAALDILHGRSPHERVRACSLDPWGEALVRVCTAGLPTAPLDAAAQALVEHGRLEPVAKGAVALLARPDGMSGPGHTLLSRAFDADPLVAWGALAEGLVEESVARTICLGLQYSDARYAWPPEPVLSWVGQDVSRAMLVLELLHFDAPELGPIARELLSRFGLKSTVARKLSGRLQATDGLVPSLKDHFRTRLGFALAWQASDDNVLAAFASELVPKLRREADWHEAHEDYQRVGS